MTRQVIANIMLSLDGRTTGPGGPFDMGWIVPHAITDQARDGLVAMTSGTTALLGRVNYQGFGGYWPPVAADESAEPRDRRFAAWLTEVEKVVFSTTLAPDLGWRNSRLATASPADTVRTLRAHGDGDIWVLSSQSIIRQLLEADEVDRLRITLAPELVGGGERLFPEGLTPSRWALAASLPTDSGAIMLTFDRRR
ncbi:MAG: dihydrofolate reductase [Kineosporiaceae bacterium]|nr:dihydrofolate reductase [Kineosporiaceae bacterium]